MKEKRMLPEERLKVMFLTSCYRFYDFDCGGKVKRLCDRVGLNVINRGLISIILNKKAKICMFQKK